MKLHYPKWFPYPSCWLNSFLLLLLLGGMGEVVKDFPFERFTPESLAIYSILFLLSPIICIAAIHHLLHLLIGYLFPKIQAPEIGEVKGLVPGLFSWWEGVYGWTVAVISTLLCLVVALICSLSETSIDFSYEISDGMAVVIGLMWLTIAAYLYQLFHLVEQRLILVGKNLQNPYNPRKKE